MKIIKRRLRNKMEDEFPVDNIIIYIEKKSLEILILIQLLMSSRIWQNKDNPLDVWFVL